ncbi:DUF4179 domain-containing protein [Paenibacillus profundus]|uniref:DUF4179 domain-containing protein n=1 Tax=Paenibacillus profundus TaxID=1173085 RepID=A0ABS8YGS0_9BACL|nr:DUF4179 domain-containing protein [Paenibacillus profundus]MCE5170414.1 DUF4179 domain-containing protein [Paenibacillus profundus]
MGHWPKQTEFAEMDAIEQMIRESSLPNKSRSDQIMNKIGESELTRRSSKRKPNIMRRTVLVASVAAILGGGVIGTGFVSPAMAATLQNIPMFGDLFKGLSKEALDTAINQGIVSDPNLSVTHDGVTLKLASLLYDGTRLSFVLEREGADLPPTAAYSYLSEEGFKGEIIDSDFEKQPIHLKGYIKRPTILVNGQEIEYDSGSFGDYSVEDDVAYKVELTHGLKLPDQFELTIQADVTQVNETFEFKTPVKIENNSLVLKPEVSKSDGQFSYTVKELVSSPVSTRLVLDSKGPVPKSPEQTGDYSASMVYYELVDDKGNVLQPDGVEYFWSEPKTEYHIDKLYSPFDGNTKSITIKPFTLTVKTKDWKVVGGNDKNRTYLKDLEVTIPIKK